MKRALYTVLFCIGVYALSLLALTALTPVLDRLPALAGGAPGTGLPVTRAMTVPHSTTPLFGRTAAGQVGQPPILAASGAPTVWGLPGVALWLLPLPPDLLVISLFLRGLLRDKRPYPLVPAPSGR